MRGGVVDRDHGSYVELAIRLSEGVSDSELVVDLVGGVTVKDYACGFGSHNVWDRSMVPKCIYCVSLTSALNHATVHRVSFSHDNADVNFFFLSRG